MNFLLINYWNLLKVLNILATNLERLYRGELMKETIGRRGQKAFLQFFVLGRLDKHF